MIYHEYSPEPSAPGCQMIDKPIIENLGCMKGPQPLHFLSAGGGVHVAEEKNSGAELYPGPAGPPYAKNMPQAYFSGASGPRGRIFHSAQIFWP